MADAPPNAVVLLSVGNNYYENVVRREGSWFVYKAGCPKNSEIKVCFKTTAINAAYNANHNVLNVVLPDGWSLKVNAITSTNYEDVPLSVLHIGCPAISGIYSMQINIEGFGEYQVAVNLY